MVVPAVLVSVSAAVGTHDVYFRYETYDLTNPIAITLAYRSVWVLSVDSPAAILGIAHTLDTTGALTYASKQLGHHAMFADLDAMLAGKDVGNIH